MWVPPGWMMVMNPWWVAVGVVGAHPVRRVHEAAVSMRAVLSKFGGLVQPDMLLVI